MCASVDLRCCLKIFATGALLWSGIALAEDESVSATVTVKSGKIQGSKDGQKHLSNELRSLAAPKTSSSRQTNQKSAFPQEGPHRKSASESASKWVDHARLMSN